uniref:PAS domain-containing protein n=2 Tax=Meloidogyne hapla TaxID=6305 RepID=A0A1I8B1Q4_MELHA
MQLTSLTPSINNTNKNQIIMRVDSEGFVTFADAKIKEILNKSMAEIIEKKFWTLVHPLDEQNVKDVLMNILKNNNVVIKDLFCKLQIGSSLEYLQSSININSFINPHSLEFEFLILTINILEEQQKHLSEFPSSSSFCNQTINNELIQQNSQGFICWPQNIQNDLLLQQQTQNDILDGSFIHQGYSVMMPPTSTKTTINNLSEQQWPTSSNLINSHQQQHILPDFTINTVPPIIWPEH